MPSLSVFRRRDPWWEVDGAAARRTRRRERVVSGMAFVAALAAIAASAIAWGIQLGLASALGVHVTLGIG